MQITKGDNGFELVGKFCPFQEEAISCGEWCALFDFRKNEGTAPHLAKIKYMIELKCTPRETNFNITEKDIVYE